MKMIDVREGMAFPKEDQGHPVDVTRLAAAKVTMVVFPEDGEAPWIERKPFNGREQDEALLAHAATLMQEAQQAIDNPPPPTLAEARQMALDNINRGYEEEVNAVVGVYPESEKKTWDRQEKEAERVKAGDAAAAPLLSKIAAARGVTAEQMADRVLGKAEAYVNVIGPAIGKRHNLEEAIEAITLADCASEEQAAKAVLAIHW